MSSTRSDEELLHAWCSGDRHAGSELFARHFPAVRRFFVNKADAAAEDLIQRTFELCASTRSRYEGRGSFEAYLFGIARNVLRKHWEKRRGRGHTADIEQYALADLGAGPSTLVAADRARKRLLDALRMIPLEQQIVLELYYWEGLNGAVLGERLGVTESTARSRLRRAKISLARVYRRLENIAGVPESRDEDLEQWATALRLQLASD